MMGWFGKKKKQDKENEGKKAPVDITEERSEDPLSEPEDPLSEPEDPLSEDDASFDQDDDIMPAPDQQSEREEGSTPSKGFFQQLKQKLSKTRNALSMDIDSLFRGRRKLDADLLEEIEELLITSDIGVSTSMVLMERISKSAAGISTAAELKAVLQTEIQSLISAAAGEGLSEIHKPQIILVVGVNGVGKTTTIGKLAALFAREGKSVLIGAADTFRAAAVEQLAIWADRAGVDMIRHRENADPAAVAFDTVEAALARGKDVVIIDTAGRLHTKVNLMEELKKIKRAVAKKIPGAPHETYLVIDATTGQNALSQAKLFNESLGLTGLILTKLDGTAKGGVVVAISHSLEIPIAYIGVGEKVDDLQRFDPEQFSAALFG